MTLSYSGWKTYQHCQRKWLYSSVIKAPRTKDAYRKEVGILSNLQSIDAWRGEIVDFTISNFIIRGLNKDICYTLEDSIKYAKEICRKRYDFAKSKRYRGKEVVKSHHLEEYSALFDVEFGKGLKTEDFKRAWNDIETSLKNFFNNHELIETLEDEDNMLIAQRPLHLKIDGFKIKGIPDLIIFNEHKPPRIIDWKVHYSGNKTYNEQLLIYALALSKSMHKDFPNYIKKFDVLEYQLSEYQLLINEHRKYPVTEEYLEETESFLIESAYQLHLAGGDVKFDKIEFENFEITNQPENCLTCPYHKICCNDN